MSTTGEGCFAKPEDYAAAALVYQHGNTPDHFFQAYIWSKHGVDLGDSNQNRMMALGIDRYLVNIGQNSFSEVRPQSRIPKPAGAFKKLK